MPTDAPPVPFGDVSAPYLTMPSDPLISVAELGTWTQSDIAEDDVYANAVVVACSNLIRDVSDHDDWTAATVPFRAKVILIRLARRTFVNPDGETRSQVGPLSSTVLDEMAYSLKLTQAEAEELWGFRPADSAPRGLWVLPTTAGTVPGGTLFLPDDSDSDWFIPYGDASEPYLFLPPDEVP